MTGIEPALSAWEADALPLDDIRKFAPSQRHILRLFYTLEERFARTKLLRAETAGYSEN
jgi:hypothetical protein